MKDKEDIEDQVKKLLSFIYNFPNQFQI